MAGLVAGFEESFEQFAAALLSTVELLLKGLKGVMGDLRDGGIIGGGELVPEALGF